MKKSKKILLSTLLPVSLVGTLSSALFVTACSTSTTSKFNEDTFKKNANVKYMDLTGTKLESQQDRVNTVSLAKSILGTKDGMKQYAETYSDAFLVDWFSKTNDPILNTFYRDQLETIKDEYNEQKKSYTDMNLFQREVLDPTGGTENSYIFQKLLPKLKEELSSSLFSKDYLGIQDKQTGEIIKLDAQSSEAMNALNKDEHINGTNPGERNSFVFDAKAAASYSNFDDYYVDFVRFIFDEWTKETLPIITPTALFKHSSGVSPKDSGLFNIAVFGNQALDGTDSNYKFQWFDPANNDPKNPNTSMKYQTFVKKMDSFVNPNTGAIEIPKYLTDDRSTMLITNGKTCYTDYVTPFAAAAMYNFSNLVLGQSAGNTSLADSVLDPQNIMTNFVSKNGAAAGSGYFTFPYDTTGAFKGEYTDVNGIRETFKVKTNNSNQDTPFIATRNEFGVHIIGIDRYNKIKEAINNKAGDAEKMQAAIVEIQNTLLWRVAQKTMLSGNTEIDNIELDLKAKLKTYFNDNASKLIFNYLLKTKDTSTQTPGAKTNAKHLFSQETIGTGEKLLDITSSSADSNLMTAILELMKVESSIEFTKLVNEKMYGNQSNYSNNQKVSDWKTFGLAGVLPYTRNKDTASFDQLTDISWRALNINSSKNSNQTLEEKYAIAKTNLLKAIKGFENKLEPASTLNYFKEKVGTQVGVSQYEFVNNWNINQILTKDASDTTVVDIYNLLWDENNIDANLANWNSTSTPTPVPPPAPNPGQPNQQVPFEEVTPSAFNVSVAEQIKQQIKTNYAIRNSFESKAQKAELTLDFSDYNKLTESADKILKEKFSNNKIGETYELSYGANSDFRTFLKTLTWLLSPNQEIDGKQTNIYTFQNLIKLLKEMIENEDTGVAYLGWNVQSTLFANDNFGDAPESDFKYKNNPLYITNMNSYSYFGAENPIKNPADVTNTYYGSNAANYFNSAKPKTTAATDYNGFVGFQSSDSSLFTSTLPSDLYSGKLLTQDPASPTTNFKGIFYRFNDGTPDAGITRNNKSKENMKAYYADDSFKLTSLAKQIETYGLGILNNKISYGEQQYYIKHALKMVIDGATIQNESLTFAQRKEIMDQIVNEIPDIAFQQLNGDSLSRTRNGTSSKVFDGEEGTLSQYVVTQFNMSDIVNFENKIKTLSENSNSSDLAFANLDLSTFYAAIVLLAQNSEVQSRANAHWTTVSKETKITVFNYNVAKKLGETVVKNWDDFK